MAIYEIELARRTAGEVIYLNVYNQQLPRNMWCWFRTERREIFIDEIRRLTKDYNGRLRPITFDITSLRHFLRRINKV